MRQNKKVLLSLMLVFSLVVGIAMPQVNAAKKLKLNKKTVTVRVGNKATITAKNTKKKVKWSIKKGKKYIKITKKKKTSVTIKGKKVGKAVILAKVGKKKLTCKVTVQKAEKPVVTKKPTSTPTKAPTATPSDNASPTPSDNTSPTPSDNASPTPDPTYVPEPVKNIVIDLSKYTTTFTASGKIDFRDQIEKRFDLSLFKSLKVTYKLVFEDDDKSDFNIVKFAVAQDSSTLNGTDDGIAFAYGQATSTTATIDLSGETIAGTAVGINIQPMNASWKWPAKLTSITITGLEFVAKSGAVYPDPSAPVAPTPTPGPTYPPTEFNYAGTDINWIDTSKPMVAFTFDDGPVGNASGSNSMKIHEALKKYNAHATFFYIGSRINNDAAKAEIKQADEYGFEVGNHSYDWNRMDTMGEAKVKDSIEKTNKLLTEITGYSNFLFRAPELRISTIMQGYINAPFIDCSVDSKDWDGATTAKIIENVEKAQDGDIVLMHETEANTVAAIETLLQYFQDKGWQVVSVSELFKAKGKKLMTGTKYSNAR
ncbi:MAG: polysaccharide deacetylase family protein [Lachnospiraceae bacterium]|nr:polysaccharide deacetylase family protein [Lachnospiraceae bacterium]